MDPSHKPIKGRASVMSLGDRTDASLKRNRTETAARLQRAREERLRARRQSNSSSAPPNATPFQGKEQAQNVLMELLKRLQGSSTSKESLDMLSKLKHILQSAGSMLFESPMADPILSNSGPKLLNQDMTKRVISVLGAFLTPRSVNEVDQRCCLEAAACLSTLATADSDGSVCDQLKDLGPVLISHLSGGQGTATAEQCAWILGHIALSGRHNRKALVAQGAVRPLTRLMLEGRSSSAAEGSLAAATAGWALSHVVEDAAEVLQMLSVEDFKPKLRKLLLQRDNPELLSNAMWLVACASSLPQPLLEAADILKPSLELITRSTSHASQGDLDFVLLTPALRTLGNLFATGEAAEILQIVSSSPDFLRGLLFAARADQHGLQKEALWALSNLAAQQLDHSTPQAMLAAAGIEELLHHQLRTGTFPVRKEAMICLKNYCQGDTSILTKFTGSSLQDAPNGVLPAIAFLARSQDPEAAILGLSAFEEVLRSLPKIGAKMVESVDGIDILEQQQARAVETCSSLATQLLDTYYGNEYGLED